MAKELIKKTPNDLLDEEMASADLRKKINGLVHDVDIGFFWLEHKFKKLKNLNTESISVEKYREYRKLLEKIQRNLSTMVIRPKY